MQGVDGAANSGSNVAAAEAIAAALQLFDLCRPADDSTIAADDLAKVLRSHLGGEAEVERILGLLRDDAQSNSEDRFNFLTYWHGMDRFFQEAGAFPEQSSPGGPEELDTIKGMRRFRDGVLTIGRMNGLLREDTISSLHLLELLQEIRANAADPSYWEEVMQAVPAEEGFGLTLSEVAEAVYIWLQDFLNHASDHQAATPGAEAEVSQVEEAVGAGAPSQFETSNNNGMMSMSLADMTARRGSYTASARRGSDGSSMLDNLGGSLGSDVQRSGELLDLIRDRTPQDNTMVHQALSSLTSIHNSIISSLMNNKEEVDRLQREVTATAGKHDATEEELARSVQYAHEIDVRFAEVERQRDESEKKVAGLEARVRDLSSQCEDMKHDLSKTDAKREDHEKELAFGYQKTQRIEGRMAELEREADSAEGRAQWMQSKLERLRVKKLVAARAARSYAACAEEGEEAAALLQQQLLSGVPLAGAEGIVGQAGKTSEETEKQMALQVGQLQRLRRVRDDLLKAHDSWAAKSPDDGSCSPRELQVYRRCSFLGAQLQALLEHTLALESLLDEGKEGINVEAEDKRLTSVKRVLEDSNKHFGEFSEKLHTLEVQKADVDQELRRLQQRFAEQDGQLRAVQRHRDQLLVEAGGGGDGEKKVRPSLAGSSVSGSPSKQMTGGFLFDGARPASNQLRASPKTPQGHVQLQRGVKTLVNAHQLIGTDSSRARARGESPERTRPNPLVFQMSARPSTHIASGQWRREEKSKHRDRSEQHRGSHRDDKAARREHKDKEARRHKGTKDEGKVGDRVRGKMRGGREEGNCETQ